jgi:hypothetical protein
MYPSFSENEQLHLFDAPEKGRMQLHRLWIEFEDGSGAFSPYKQTEVALVVKPAEHLSYSLRADAPGRSALRSPLMFNLQSGVFRTEALTTIHTVRCGLFELQGQLSTRCGLAAILFLTASRSLVTVDARTAAPQRHDRSTGSMPGLNSSGMGNRIFLSTRLDQPQGRAGKGSKMSWEGGSWFGDNVNKLWLKSEGFSKKDAVCDSDPEVVYDHTISRPHSFEARAANRAGLDSDRYRARAVLGAEGLAPYSVEAAPTRSGPTGCREAGRATDSTHLPPRRKWILQPKAELTPYNQEDQPVKLDRASPTSKPRGHLRYEVSHKFAP